MKIKIALFTFIIVILIPVGFVFYIQQDIKIMQSHYPYFNLKTKQYEWAKQKPEEYKSLKEVSSNIKWAIVISEDWAYFDHNGIDFNQLKIVLDEGLEEGKITRGASTITQQLVKNLFLSDERTITRKLIEMLYAFILEKTYSKDFILERYLNIIELGDDIYGVEKAALHYFGKQSKDLNLKEACFIAVLLPSPIRYSQSYRDNELTDFMQTQIDELLVKLRQAKIINRHDQLIMELTPIYFNH